MPENIRTTREIRREPLEEDNRRAVRWNSAKQSVPEKYNKCNRGTVFILHTFSLMQVDLRLALSRESGHLTQEAMLADVRRATGQYFLEALPAEAILVWVAQADGTTVATSGLIFFQKPPSERNLTGLEASLLNMYTVPVWRRQDLPASFCRLSWRMQSSVRLIGSGCMSRQMVDRSLNEQGSLRNGDRLLRWN
jgi:hypothetical protein